MPRIAADPRAGILQRLELETALPEPDRLAESEQSLSIGRDEVRHLAPFPDVAVQPQAPVHRVNHPRTTGLKLSIFRTCQRLFRRLRSAHFRTTPLSIELRSACDH
jgi:hypothetical protein